MALNVTRGPRERRVRERRETRELILDAAREMFVKDGVESVTMRAIGKKIEYTPTAIYHHFRDKHALLRELCANDTRALAQAFHRIGRIEDPVERLRRIGQAYLRFGLEHPNHYRFLFMTVTPDVENGLEKGNPEEDAYGVLRATVAEAIAAGRLRPELRDPDQVALMCWSVTHGIISLSIVFDNDDWIAWPDPERTGLAAVDALMRGIVREGL
ncbi:MAG: helix-turn-helix transcriptional regulator [Gemmatimonadales bacterium]|nr:helix-turn-helix transcriptional regulator [Gemmatimonadales bacterium]